MKLNVRKRPGRSWEYRFEGAAVDGRRKQYGKGGFATKREALEAGTAAMAEYNRAGLVREETAMSVADYLDLWMERYVAMNCRPRTREVYALVVRCHIKPALGHYRLASLTTSAVQDFVNEKAEGGMARSYVRNVMFCLNGALRYAVAPLGLIASNPCDGVSAPREVGAAPREQRTVSRAEWAAIIGRFAPGSRFRAPLLLGYRAGLRVAEACGLTWDRVDLDAGTLTVDRIVAKRDGGWRFGPPKTKTSRRTILLGDTLREELRGELARQEADEAECGLHYVAQWLMPDGTVVSAPIAARPAQGERVRFVSLGDGGDWCTTDSTKYLARVVHGELGLPFRFHDLRHTHAAMMVEAGASPKAVSERLGHSSVQITLDVYTECTDALAASAVEAFDRSTGADGRGPSVGGGPSSEGREPQPKTWTG